MLKKYIYLIVNLLLLIPSIIFVYTYAYNYVNKELVHLEKKSAVLLDMENIYKIVINLQKIRGLSNIENKNTKILNKIEVLDKKNNLLARQVNNSTIDEILKKDKKKTISSFNSYTCDIEEALLTYKLLAYKANLILNSDTKEYLLSKSVINYLPYLAEYFARIRGLSASVHEHQLDNEIKIKIKNQIYIIQELLKSTHEIKYFTDSGFAVELLSSQKKEIKFIKQELTNTKHIKFSGLEIFDIITKNIDYLHTLYNKNINNLTIFYQDKIEKKNFIKKLIIFTAICSLLVVILLNLFYFAKTQKYIKKIEQLNLIDPMTELYNRRFLEEVVSKIMSQSERNEDIYSVLMLDVDWFKKVNDTYGHDVGDTVIVEIAKVIKKNIRDADLAIRYGGEEFVIILHNPSKEGTLFVANKIHSAFGKKIFNVGNGNTIQKTLSIGIAHYPSNGDSIWKCIKYADTALYVAKTTGRNKIVEYTQNMSENKN